MALTFGVSEAKILMVQGPLATTSDLAHQIAVVALCYPSIAIASGSFSLFKARRLAHEKLHSNDCIRSLGFLKMVTLLHHWKHIICVRRKVYLTGSSECLAIGILEVHLRDDIWHLLYSSVPSRHQVHVARSPKSN